MRSSIVAAWCASLMLVAPAAFAGGPKIGVVDVQKVMEAIPAWKKAMDGLKKDFDSKKAQLDAKQAELKKQKDQIDAKRMISDPKAIAAEEQKFMQAANQLQADFMQAQQEISGREGALKESVLSRIERAVAMAAQVAEADFVFETGPEQQPNVLYAPKKLDITNHVIDAYKKTFGDQPIVAQGGPPKRQPAAGTPK